MSQLFFILNAPPLSFTKSNLYEKSTKLKESAPYIKSIADSFFLSNQFRRNLLIYYCTSYQGMSFVITFEGSKLRYLGPSFFSSAHLILRAKNHILDSNSRDGKLTPGISVLEQSSDWIFEKHKEDKIVQVISKCEKELEFSQEIAKHSNVFAYGFEKLPLSINSKKLLLKHLMVDEQVIITNYLLESVR